ncbi:hypothetical protein GF319_14840 [Candidatus Bathyarchaeota archaeon]|nr:hypothetical protein [Candidatus Bathyarchaeota archaeon]
MNIFIDNQAIYIDMSNVVSRIWEPVRRRGSERYLQITILSFAGSVSLTRLILELTGYPQLGNQVYHIAHVLYGGVLLFIAGLLPQIFANRWVYTWNSILTGVGVGLFIDEVGKFITQNNDYFFPAAAPIIYAFFLVTVLLYVRISGEPKLDARGELYMILESLSEVLDHSLEMDERNEIQKRLERITDKTKNPNYIKLSKELKEFIDSDALKIMPEKENFFDKVINVIKWFEDKYITSERLKLFLIISLFLLGIPSSLRFMRYSFLLDSQSKIDFLSKLVSELPGGSDYSLMWARIHVIIDGIVGLILGTSAILIMIGKNRWGSELGSLALLVSLVAVNFVLFYIQQFSSIAIAAYQYSVLQGLYYFERTFINST